MINKLLEIVKTESTTQKVISGETFRPKNQFTRFLETIGLKIRLILEETLLKSQINRFYLIFGGHIFFETLRTACQLDLFTLLHERKSLTREEIRKLLNLEDQPLRIILLGLVSIGLLKKRGDKYSNTLSSHILFNRHSKRNVLAYVELQHHAMYPALHHLLESVKENRNVGLEELDGEGKTIYERLEHNPSLEVIFQDAMHELSIQTNRLLVEAIDLSHTKHLIDVGGGDGTNIMEFARKWPHLKATVFDFPGACSIADENLETHGLSHRLNTIPGDCFKDEFPKQADSFLFSHFFTIWSPEKDKFLLKKAYHALPKGGRVIIFNMMQKDDETGPLSAAVGSPYFLSLATGEGMLYTSKEYETWMKEAGFSKVQRIKLPIDHGVIIGTK